MTVHSKNLHANIHLIVNSTFIVAIQPSTQLITTTYPPPYHLPPNIFSLTEGFRDLFLYSDFADKQFLL